MMIFLSNGEPSGYPKQFAVPGDPCEECGCNFDSVGGATLCRDCVRKLFEAKPDIEENRQSDQVMAGSIQPIRVS